MLTELEINNLGPIRKAIIHPSQGMTAITGETGAGKSMLLSALTMLTGGTISNDKVSAGADKSTASGVFDYEYASNDADNSNKPEPLRLSDEHDIEYETDEQPADNASNDDDMILDSELILRRTIPAKGRGKCVINDETITRKTMSIIGSSMITIHGQSEQLRVSSASKQLEMLDSYAGNNEALNAYITAYENRMKFQKQLDEINNPETLQRIDYLKESIRKIRKADLHDGEYDELKQKINEMENNETRLENINKALMILDGDDNSMNSMLSILIPILEDLNINGNHANTDDDNMNDDSDNASIIDSVYDMKETISNITNILSKSTDDIESFNIDDANERMMIISSVIRKFGGSEAKALEWLHNAENELDRIDVDEDSIDELQQDLKELIEIENKAADALTATRKEAAKMLTVHVNNELKQLAMPNSSFKVNIETGHDDNHVSITGHDKVSFMFKAYENAPELPIGKSASGGELSRLTLALELTIASKHPNVSSNMTFVFDEVDAGIGGKTGIEIGKRLAELAKTSQVIIVTHLAQVAAYADAQYVVSKHVNNDDNITETIIKQVNDNERIIEIARMLSGDDSEISIKHAEQLLANSKV